MLADRLFENIVRQGVSARQSDQNRDQRKPEILPDKYFSDGTVAESQYLQGGKLVIVLGKRQNTHIVDDYESKYSGYYNKKPDKCIHCGQHGIHLLREGRYGTDGFHSGKFVDPLQIFIRVEHIRVVFFPKRFLQKSPAHAQLLVLRIPVHACDGSLIPGIFSQDSPFQGISFLKRGKLCQFFRNIDPV